VFLFNHQSNFDGLLMMKLLRRDVTAVAKKEVRTSP
jgi:1-acyl-sn-glycerol-3-phosphate acyltransferase